MRVSHQMSGNGMVEEDQLAEERLADEERPVVQGSVLRAQNRGGNGPKPVSDWAGKLTLAGAEAAYLALVVYLVVRTLHSPHLKVANVSDAVTATTGTLAAAFAVGYATVLGVPPAEHDDRRRDASRPVRFFGWLGGQFSLRNLLALGVFLYMAAGAALGLTYLTHTVEAPGVVKTVAVAFGGYVVAYIGKAYKDYSG